MIYPNRLAHGNTVFIALFCSAVVFVDHIVTSKVFPEYLPSSVPMIGSVADDHNSFTGNEDKYVKLKQKQYAVGTSLRN